MSLPLFSTRDGREPMRWHVVEGLLQAAIAWGIPDPSYPLVRATIVGVACAPTAVHCLKHVPTVAFSLVDPWRATGYQDTPSGPLTDGASERHLGEALKRLKPYEGRYALFRMTSAQAALVWVAAQSQTLVFVDANHLYPHIKLDLDLWTLTVRPDGIICGHDYGHRGATGDFGVTEAVDEAFGDLVHTGPDHTWWVRL